VCGVETSGGLGPTWAATPQNAKYCTLCAHLTLTKFVFLTDTIIGNLMMNLSLFYSYGRRIGVAEGTEFNIAVG